MKIGEAVGLFLNIGSDRYTDNEKGTAIKMVLDMPTHMGITKDAMLRVIDYLLRLSFDVNDGNDETDA